jgi:hypothetical protein
MYTIASIDNIRVSYREFILQQKEESEVMVSLRETIICLVLGVSAD